MVKIGGRVTWLRRPREGGLDSVPARVLHAGERMATIAVLKNDGRIARKRVTLGSLAPRTEPAPSLDCVWLSKL